MSDKSCSLRALYSVMQSKEARLGGGEGVEGLYGSISKAGMQKILNCMRDHCGLDAKSLLVDIGAGLGRPLLHALLDPGIAGAYGIELDAIKCDKAKAFLAQTLAELKKRGAVAEDIKVPRIRCAPVEEVPSLEPATHAYSFWEGVPFPGKHGFGRLFAASRSLQAVTVVQRAMRTDPVDVMFHLGFGTLQLVASFPVSMSGSGRSFRAYVFNRTTCPPSITKPLAALCLNSAAKASAPAATNQSSLPSSPRPCLVEDADTLCKPLTSSDAALDGIGPSPSTTPDTSDHQPLDNVRTPRSDVHPAGALSPPPPGGDLDDTSPSVDKPDCTEGGIPSSTSGDTALGPPPRRSNRLHKKAEKKAELARLCDKENKVQSASDAAGRKGSTANEGKPVRDRKSPARHPKSPEGVQKLSPGKTAASGLLTSQINFRHRRKPGTARSLAAKMASEVPSAAVAVGLAEALSSTTQS